MPSRYQEQLRREIEEHGLEYGDPDKEIVPFILDLIKYGYPTYSSCAGHPGDSLFDTGFVWLNQDLTSEEEREVRQIAKSHSLSVISVSRGSPGEKDACINFKPVGGKH